MRGKTIVQKCYITRIFYITRMSRNVESWKSGFVSFIFTYPLVFYSRFFLILKKIYMWSFKDSL